MTGSTEADVGDTKSDLQQQASSSIQYYASSYCFNLLLTVSCSHAHQMLKVIEELGVLVMQRRLGHEGDLKAGRN